MRPALAVMLLIVALAVSAAGFEVRDARSRLVEGTYLVDAQIVYEFSERALEALDNGVPLTVDVHLQVRREGAWVWESDVQDMHLRRQLLYHPLSSLFEVRDLGSGEKQNFATRRGALDALGEISDLPVVEADALEPGEGYRMELRASLDIEALPLPLRPRAYITADWNLSSEWSQWRLRP